MIGVVVLFLAASTEGPTSLINYVPLAAHVVLDYALAGVLIALPFILGFSDETAPTAFFIAIGVLHLLVTIGTRFRPAEERRRKTAPRENVKDQLRPGDLGLEERRLAGLPNCQLTVMLLGR